MHSEAKQIETSELEQIKIYFCVKQGEQVAHAQKNPEIPKGFSETFSKARWGRSVPESVISWCTIFWFLVDGDQSVGARRSGGNVLMILKYWVVNFFHLVVFEHLKNSGNKHQKLLPRSFRTELKQRIWRKGLPQEGPIGSCLVMLPPLSPSPPPLINSIATHANTWDKNLEITLDTASFFILQILIISKSCKFYFQNMLQIHAHSPSLLLTAQPKTPSFLGLTMSILIDLPSFPISCFLQNPPSYLE